MPARYSTPPSSSWTRNSRSRPAWASGGWRRPASWGTSRSRTVAKAQRSTWGSTTPSEVGGGAMRALVTGGTGFVGSQVVRALVEDGVTVRVLARSGSDRRALADLPVEIVAGDLAEPSSL